MVDSTAAPGDQEVAFALIIGLLINELSDLSRSIAYRLVKWTAQHAIRPLRDGLLAAIRLNINNGHAEGLNNAVRLIIRGARGFHSAEAALALVMLSCGPITLQLPHEQSP